MSRRATSFAFVGALVLCLLIGCTTIVVATARLALQFGSGSVAAGDTITLQISVRDIAGNLIPSYEGTLQLTCSDPSATFPASVTMTAADAGSLDVAVAFPTAGTAQINAVDTADPTLTAVATITVLAGPATAFDVSAPSTTPEQAPFSTTVTARDAFGNVASAYLGTIQVSSTDPLATLPPNYAFTSADAGVHTFTDAVTYRTIGLQRLLVEDSVNPAIFGFADTTVIAYGAASIEVSGIADPTFAGDWHPLTITVRDSGGAPAIGYTGTVTFTSSDPAAVLLPAYTFVPADNATVTLPDAVRFLTGGLQSVTATDIVVPTVNGSQTVTVSVGGPAAFLGIDGLAGPVTAGAPQSVLVRAVDAVGHLDINYTGTVAFTSSDPAAVLPPPYTFQFGDRGEATFTGLQFSTLGPQTLTVTDTVVPALMAMAFIDVVPPALGSLEVTGLTAPFNAGDSATLTVTARDPGGAVITGFVGTVRFTSTDPQADLPTDYTFQPADMGVATFPAGVTLRTAGLQTVTVTDLGSALFGEDSVTVDPLAAVQLYVHDVPATQRAGDWMHVDLSALDVYGNVDPTYLGTVTFTSTDPQAVLPTDYTFLPADLGYHRFDNIRLATVGLQWITATDIATPSITGFAIIDIYEHNPNKLGFIVNPGTTGVGTAITPAVQVQVQDVWGNPIPGATNAITVSMGANPAGATLTGTLTRNAVSGVATFDDLTLDRIGTGFTLRAQAAGLNDGSSAPFEVTGNIAPDVVSASVPPGPLSGNVQITYAVEHVFSERVTVIVEIDLTGTGSSWFRATAAPSAPGEFGSYGVPTTSAPGGLTHTYFWNSTRDVPNATVTGVSIRVFAHLDGFVGLDQVLTGLTIENGLRFATPYTTAAGATPSAIARGDLNRDGQVDLVTANGPANTVSVLLGSGGGGFAAPVAHAVGTNPRDVLLIDFDGDAILDLVAVNSGSNDVTLRLGDGLGGFGAVVAIATGTGPIAVAAGDVDIDGDLDLVIANASDTSVTLLINATPRGGPPTFTAGTPVATGNAPSAVVLADFDRDGDLDLAAANANDNTVTVFTGDGTGSFMLAATVPVGAQPNHLATADIDRDAIADLVVACAGAPSVVALIGNGSAGFTAQPAIALAAAATSLTLARLDEDAAPDITITTATDLLTLQNDGAGSFGSAVARANLNATDALTADIDRDGRTDLIAIDTSSNLATLVLNNQQHRVDPRPGNVRHIHANGRVEAFAAADFNGDGKVDLAVGCLDLMELGIFLGDGTGDFLPPTRRLLAEEPIAVESADLNGDDADDVVVVTDFNIYAFLNNGTGALTQSYHLLTLAMTDLELADVNEDGDIDAVVASDSRIRVLLGDGAGGFAAPVDAPPLAGGMRHFRIVDLNEDENLDVVATLTSAALSLQVAFGDGAGGFSPGSTYTPGANNEPRGLTVADFDNDNDLDVAFVTRTSDQLFIMRGDGTGGLSLFGTYAVANNPYSVFAHDVDRDGNLDLVVGGVVKASAIGVMTGDGLGAFAAAVNYIANPRVYEMEFFDANQDGIVDLIAASESAGGVVVMRGNAAGTLDAAATITIPDAPGYASLADLDRNGIADLLVGGTSAVTPLLGDGMGSYTVLPAIPTGSSSAAIAADFNQDGIEDIAITVSSELWFRAGLGGGSFGPPTIIAAAQAEQLTSADMNRDGRLDLVFVQQSPRELWVLLNTTSRGSTTFSFTLAANAALPDYTLALQVADFNRDGFLDAVVACLNQSVHISFGDGTGAMPTSQTLVGAGSAVAVGDMNGDGIEDLVTTQTSPYAVRVRLGDGAGGFTLASTVVLPQFAVMRVMLGDVDGDGNVDAAVAHRGAAVWLRGDGVGGLAVAGAHQSMDTLIALVDVNADGLLDIAGSTGTGFDAAITTALAGR